jgi:hypothetical protein
MQISPYRYRLLVAGLPAVAVATFLVGSLTTSSRGAEVSTASPTQQAYVPSISDMMIATIQPRHERLWQAAKDGNWDFAAYELGNLRGAFGRLGRAHPMQEGIAFPGMIEAVTKEPLAGVDRAIHAKDTAAFTKAYSDMTDACNSCHQALNHGVVVIGMPSRAQSSDLDTRNKPTP